MVAVKMDIISAAASLYFKQESSFKGIVLYYMGIINLIVRVQTILYSLYTESKKVRVFYLSECIIALICDILEIYGYLAKFDIKNMYVSKNRN